MNKEEMQNYYIEMLIQDLEEHSFEYWESTQDEMVEALRNLQQKVNQLENTLNEVRKECETNIRIFDSGKSYSIAVKDVSKDVLKILDKEGGSNE